MATTSRKGSLTRLIAKPIQLIPSGSRAFIYDVVLSPPALRWLTNRALRMVLPETTRVGDVVLSLNREDPVVSGSIALGSFEPGETAFVWQRCPPGAVFVDVGANIGYYTAIAAQAVGADGRVFAIEPEERNFTYLARTVRENSLVQVELVRAAAAEATDRRSLFLSRDNAGDHRLIGEEGREIVRVDTVRIDDLLDDEHLRATVIIKIDVQGAEGLVLEGASRTLREASNLTVITEFWPYGLRRADIDPVDFLERLQRYGGSIFRLAEPTGELETIRDRSGFVRSHEGRTHSTVVLLKDNTSDMRSA